MFRSNQGIAFILPTLVAVTRIWAFIGIFIFLLKSLGGLYTRTIELCYEYCGSRRIGSRFQRFRPLL